MDRQLQLVVDELSKANIKLHEPYQVDGVKWMLQREMSGKKAGLLCDEPGLGKTIQTIATMIGNEVEHTLIVVPISVIGQWKDTVQLLKPEWSVLVHHGTTRAKSVEELHRHNVVVTSYSCLMKLVVKRANGMTSKTMMPTVLHNMNWGRVILDECHEIRNASSQRCKFATMIRAPIRWGLTGTPVQNRMDDIVTLFKYMKFDPVNLKKRMDGLKDEYVLRRTKEDVCEYNPALKMPNLTVKISELEFASEEERSFYKKVYNNVRDEFNEMQEGESAGPSMVSMLELLLRLKQTAVHPQLVLNGYSRKYGTQYEPWEGHATKTKALISKIKATPDERSLVFCEFREEIDILENALKREELEVRRLDGSMSLKQRVDLMNECNDPELDKPREERSKNIDVLIIQIKAGGVGLNLQKFSRVYITVPNWNPCNEIQAIARAHRLGQDSKVVVEKLVVVDRKTTEEEESIRTIDERILGIQEQKRELMVRILNDERLKYNGIRIRPRLNRRDFRVLLR